MNIPSSMPRLKGFRYPREVIAYAVWAYHRFALSTADVEDLLAERGIIVSRETVRLWVNRFGAHFAACIRRDRPKPSDKWHMDEVVITIRGKKHWLWRAIDANGDVLDILVQARRNAKAARRFFKRLVVQFGEPRVVITDKLRSYIKPVRTLPPQRVVAWVSQRSERALTLEHGHMTASNSGRPRSVISLRTVTAILTSVFWFSKLRAFSFGPMTPFQRPICVSTLLR